MFQWFVDLSVHHATAYTILVLSLVIAGGLVIGGLRFRGISLGAAGVLFVGLLVGQFGQQLDAGVLNFLKEFGLVLFVFTIGLQLGPGFIASLRSDGLRLNLLAGGVVLLGCLLTALAVWLLPLHPAGVLGVLSGAVTNTPSLGATQQALGGMANQSAATLDLPAIAYAVAYPGGIAGIIASLLLLRWLGHVDVAAATKAYDAERSAGHEPLERRTLLVDNPHLDGVLVADIPGHHEAGVTISRIRPKDESEVRSVTAKTVVHVGDRVLVVGTKRALDHVQIAIGSTVPDDLVDVPGRVTFQRLVVTATGAVGQTLGHLRLDERFGVTVTRVLRNEVQMPPSPGLKLYFGDVVQVVGERDALEHVAAQVGNRPQELSHTYFAPIFLGIALGVIVGMVEIAVPGLPEPVRLGLAGGPLLVAIILGRAGSIGRLIWHMPAVANHSFRELGIALFLACVGLKAGPAFFDTVATTTGAWWLGIGLVITMVPLLIVGGFAMSVLRMNYLPVSGLIAGSMTDPPALAFANGLAGSEGPATAYATVYPLTMLLRIVLAQVLVVLLCH
ncbi:MAG TPA: putative transporter [Planctomycetota bacterium]|nr:putative transporter [Planctomycetota bacterium]